MPQTSSLSFIPPNIRWLARPFGVVILLYWIERLLFMGLHPDLFSGGEFSDWFAFVWLSLRFDLSAIATVNVVFLVVLGFPFSLKGLGVSMTRLIFCLINWVFLAINLADAWFFTFNGRRTSFDTLAFLWADIGHQAPQLVVSYWFVGLIGLLLAWVLFQSFPKKNPTTHSNSNWLVALPVWLGIVLVTVVLIRNSFQLKPLLPGHAFSLSRPEMGHGILNTPFVLFKTYENKPLEAEHWLSDLEVRSILARPLSRPSGNLKGANVVILILESFGTEYTGLEGNPVSYTPFLDSLANAGLWFPNHYANGRTSKDAMPALLAGIPAWMDEPFASSQYATNSIDGLGSLLRKNGYQTAFYHGGKNGTMSFDVFTKMVGLRKYTGMNEYPNAKQDYDGNWGIFDEPFLQYMANDLNQTQQPFGAVAFTLSSHQPYTIPSGNKNQFRKGPLPIHEAIGYADYSLRQFFKTASRMPWYSQTLFILTADHTQENYEPRYSDLKGSFDVPLIFFHPTKKLYADTSKWVKHIDLSPSVTDVLGFETLPSPLGTSVFQSTENYPIEYQNDLFLLFHPQGILSWRAIDQSEGWAWIPKINHPEPTGLRKKMVAQVQFYRVGMVKNELRPSK